MSIQFSNKKQTFQQLVMLIPILAVSTIAYEVLWRLWHAKHQPILMIGHVAWSVEFVRTLILVAFLLWAVYKKNFHDFFVASVCCAMTDAAWLIRLITVQMR